MSKIQVLDCTLRDGGYVNNWEFGYDAICGVKDSLVNAGIDIIELGFLRDEEYSLERSIYSDANKISDLIKNEENDKTIYAGLIEMANYFPPEKLRNANENAPQALRYSFWKRLIDDAYDYCSIIKEKGYLLCCQPTRVEQYSDEDFAEMCRRFSQLEPYALYIVDTFGLLRKNDLLRYAKIANENLSDGIILGYHAHDNMGQAFGNACAFLEQDYGCRTIQVDASIRGMGRGAGNLKLELICEYLNKYHGTSYKLSPIYDAWDKYIKPIHTRLSWGYEIAYFICAVNECNPNYAIDFLEHGLSTVEINKAIMSIEGPDKYLYSPEKAKKYGNF